MSTPRIAVLLCMHDGASFLQEQLDSLACQRTRPVAIFVHDWGSRDASVEIARRFARDQAGRLDVRVVCHSQAPGACRSFLDAMRECLASDVPFDHLALCDQDDVWDADRLSLAAQALERSADRSGPATPPAGVLHSDVRLIDERGRALAPSFYGRGPFVRRPARLRDPAILLVNPVIGMTMCVSRPVVEACVARRDGPWLMHDWALVLTALAHAAPTELLAGHPVAYRQHPRNVLGAPGGRRLTQRWRKARRHFLDLRTQLEGLGPETVAAIAPPWSALARRGGHQRWMAARAALASGMLKPVSRWALAAALLLLWPRSDGRRAAP